MIWVYLFVVAVCIWFVLPFIAKKVQITRLRRSCRVGRSIALTYDDGPSTRVTDDVLDILRSRTAVATFFLLGHKVDTSIEGVARITNAGHEIGSHSYQHLHAWKQDPISVYLDIKKGLRAVRYVAECRLFRAPYGKVTLGSLIQVAMQGCRLSWWTIDSTDTWERPRGIEEILDQVRSQGGGVVLFHDLDRPAKLENEKFVLDLTRRLLDLAEDEGFRICKLGELICE